MSNRVPIFPVTRAGHQAHWKPCGKLPSWYGRTFRSLSGDWVLRGEVWEWVPHV